MSDWLTELGEPFRAFALQAYAFLPRVLLAAVVLLVGWLIARALRFTAVRVLERVKRLLPGRAVTAEETQVEGLASRAVGELVFWLILLIAAEAAFEILGLEALMSVFAVVAAYLPRIIAAVLVVVVGVLLANFTGSSVERTARSGGVAYASSIGKAVKAAVLLIALVVAVGQVGLDSTLLVIAVATFLAAFLGAVALAFGLGAHLTVSNLIASHYLQRTYRVNQRVRIGEHEGRIVELRPTGVMLDTADGIVLVPGRRFSEQASILLVETE